MSTKTKTGIRLKQEWVCAKLSMLSKIPKSPIEATRQNIMVFKYQMCKEPVLKRYVLYNIGDTKYNFQTTIKYREQKVQKSGRTLKSLHNQTWKAVKSGA